MEIEGLSEKVYNKLKNEYEKYVEELSKKDVNSIIEQSYETAIKNEMVEMFYSNCQYDEEYYRQMLNEDNLLNCLYYKWMKSDYNICTILEFNVNDYISDLSNKDKSYER